VEKGSTKRKYGSSIDWLEQADLVTACASVSKIEFPLDSFADSNSVRLYPLDTGLLLGMFDYSVKMALMNDGTEESPVILQAKGGIYEALVADILTKNGHRNLYFYKNDTTAIEIEFLIQSDAGIVPIEVKAGNNRSRSLDRILKKNQAMTGYKLIDGNVGVSDRKVSIPLYMAMFL
jgi:predicted AAA+ superfamily ATPase